NDLKNRKGGYIFSAIILSKGLGFLLSIFVINTISTTEFGLVSYAYNIISFVAPFAGFGIFQSLGRYGPLQKSQNKKRQLFKFVLTKGILASILLTGIVLAFSSILTSSLPDSHNHLILISFLIISLFIFEVVKIYFRIHHINKLFAYLEISHSIVLLVLGVILTYLFGGFGYLLSIIISPLIIAIYIIIRYGMIKAIEKNDYSKDYKKSLWSYGFFTSLGGLTSQLIFSIDILTIGYLIHDPREIAYYKAASLIPFALLFIPNGVMKTDLVKLTQNYQNKAYLKKYVKNYMKLLTLISILLAVLLSLFSEQLMSLFGVEYTQATDLIPVFAIGIIGAFVFRGLFGNLLDAIGWAKTSASISISILIIDIILNYFLIKNYGIIGAAYSTSLLLWIAGIVAYIAFRKHLNQLT
ncbi:MAG: oligosaccharide flippase family protein, partial [Vicingaceae bacterium]|nr:oligosaccharide flippase family protein [Vicingaceae bacterium]